MSKFHKILVLGKCGSGKSTFCNYILDYPEKKFKERDHPDASSNVISGYAANPNSKNKGIFMIETYCLSDGLGRDQEIIDKIRSELKREHCDGIKSIIIIENINERRISAEVQRQITIYCKMFSNPEFWYHVGIVFSFSFESFPEQVFLKYKKQKLNEYLPSLVQQVEKFTKEMNGQLPQEKQIKIPNFFQCFFTDCGEVFPPQTHERTDNEISNLLSQTREQEYLYLDKDDFKAVFIDYRNKKEIEPTIEYAWENISMNEVKETYKYFRRYEATDFYDNKSVIIEKEPYKIEIFYIKQEIDIEERLIVDENRTIKKEKIMRMKKVKCDKDHNIIDAKIIGIDHITLNEK